MIDQKEQLNNFTEWLKEYAPTQKDGYIDITIPVVIRVCNGLLTLRISVSEEGYTVRCPLDIFEEANENAEYYFKLFAKYDKNYHYEMQIKDDFFYKQYPCEYSLVCALDEFARFFILLDDFILANGVIGREEEFPL